MSMASILNAVLLGVALAMDAFSVSIANALHEPYMRNFKKIAIAGTFAFFQFLMPMIGWVCVHTILDLFTAFQVFIPWIALILLVWIGGNMIREGIGKERAAKCAAEAAAGNLAGAACETITPARLVPSVLFVQGIATSIDALSTGFAFAGYHPVQALVSALIIAAETFGICMGGLWVGARFGKPDSGKSTIVGGIILIAIGLEIFIKGI